MSGFLCSFEKFGSNSALPALQGIEKEEMLSSTPDSLLRERSAESDGYAHTSRRSMQILHVDTVP